MTSGRMRRVDEAIRQVIGEVVAGELKDPRVGFVTVTDVKTSADLSHARVYVSVLGDDRSEIDRRRGTRPFRAGRFGDAGRNGDSPRRGVSPGFGRASVSPIGRRFDEQREATLAGLRSAHGYVQRRVASELRLKRTPTLDFIYDDTTDRAMRLEALLDKPEAGQDQSGSGGEQPQASGGRLGAGVQESGAGADEEGGGRR